jgi:hypothetical protein
MTSMNFRLAEHPFGRVLLHVACALRDHHWSWHWAGIRRELRARDPRLKTIIAINGTKTAYRKSPDFSLVTRQSLPGTRLALGTRT